MLPEVGTQEGGLPNQKYKHLSWYTRWKHHSKTYVFVHGLLNGDTVNPVPCYRKSEPKMAAAQLEIHISELVAYTR